MSLLINLIVNNNSKLFGKNPSIEKINVGFTNTIYQINNTYIIKICTNSNNEVNFIKEIKFYNKNKNNPLIPKMYYYSTNNNKIPYFYEIIEKVEGVSLYNIWHKLSENQREKVIRQLCTAMKQIHSKKGKYYNWAKTIKERFIILFNQAIELEIFNKKEQKQLKEAYIYFDKYLDTKEIVLVHNDLHFDNIIVNNEKIKIIDFERAMFAPRDYELNIIYQMIRKPWKYASEETEKFTDKKDYKNILIYIKKYYPELMNTKYLFKRLAIYDIIYLLPHLIKNPHLNDLKKDILFATNIIIK